MAPTRKCSIACGAFAAARVDVRACPRSHPRFPPPRSDNADAFEKMSDSTDDRVNDGNNYKGLMKASDYKAKREAVVAGNVSDETLVDQKMAAAMA
eukprot:4804461-Prymnesium_polylepis.1